MVVLTEVERARFHGLYRDHFDFVFRNLRRMGIPASSIDDALQEVYMVALRHIENYKEGSYAKAWLFAIGLRVARNYRRTLRRRGVAVPLAESRFHGRQPDPFEERERSEAHAILRAFLDSLDADKRAVFVMSELEQMSVPEIAQVVSANINTVYSRVHAARRDFARFVAQLDERGDREEG